MQRTTAPMPPAVLPPAPIAPCDLPSLRALRQAAIAGTSGRGLTAQQLRFWTALEEGDDCLDHCVEGLAWLVAGEDGQALAFAVARPGMLPHLAALYVAPHAQRHGLGALLLRLLEMQLAARGARRLATSACDASAAFYVRHGYRPGFAAHYRGTRRDGGAVLTFLHLHKPLAPSTGTIGARTGAIQWPTPAQFPP